MSAKVIVIGLDSADSERIKNWASQGYLPTFHQLLTKGAYGDLRSTVPYCGTEEECSTTEILWSMFLSGCKPNKTGYWSITDYNPETYTIQSLLTSCSYSYQEYPLFYALGEQFNIAALNIPSSAISSEVTGLQLMGWSGHYPGVPQQSDPPDLLESVVSKYGQSPVLFKDDGIWWDDQYINWERKAVQESFQTHAKLYRDCLNQQSWDLFVAAFSELHSTGHDLYAHSEADHPLYPHLKTGGYRDLNPLRESYQALDQALEEILANVSEETYVLIFSPHGIGPNFSDLPSYLFLPELLYRLSFPGKAAFTRGNPDTRPAPIITSPIRNGWTAEVWASLHESNPLRKLFRQWAPRRLLRRPHHGLRSPHSEEAKDTAHGWMPAMWYQPFWPQMKAFALPAFANGLIRINLQGRERNGIVPISEYDALCNEITEMLSHLKDGRTGLPLVKKVVRTHQKGTEDDPKLPHADLVVYWQENITDVVDSPELGRIGPIIYPRTGTHRERGFFLLTGPGIKPGSHLPTAEMVDLAPTILELIQAQCPDYFDGRSILQTCAL